MQLKRILSMLLAAALIFTTSMVTVNAETIETIESIETFEVGVVAETTAPVSLSPAIYKSGDEVSVKISADQNTGITILKFSIKFDPNALEFVDYTSANLFSNDIEGVYVYSDSICYTLMMNNVSTATGEMLTLKFKVKDTFCGDVAIYAEVFDGQDKNCINGLNVVPFVGGRASFAAHAVDVDAGVVTDPTCTKDGYTTYHCDICNGDVEGNTLASLGHTSSDPVEENRIEPTCTEDGAYDSVVYCSVCSEELSREVITIDATGHTAGNAVEENRVNPTCTEDGAHDSVVYCSVCDEELSRETITLNKLGHDIITLDAQSPTCTQVGWDAYDTCSRCDYTTYKEKAALGHKYENYVSDNNATCQKLCTETAECEYGCGETDTRDILDSYADHVFDDDFDKECNVEGCGFVRTIGAQLIEENGVTYYYYDGVKSTETGLVEFEGKQIYINKGRYFGATGIVTVDGKKVYVRNGKFLGATGIVTIDGKKLYIRKGYFLGATGIVTIDGKKLYIRKGYFLGATGIVTIDGKKLYIRKGYFLGATGIVTINGKKHYINKGYFTGASGKVKVGGKIYTVVNGIVK